MKQAEEARIRSLVLLTPRASAPRKTAASAPSATSGRRGMLRCASPPIQRGSVRSAATAAASFAIEPV
jgi:hypothetical protein